MPERYRQVILCLIRSYAIVPITIVFFYSGVFALSFPAASLIVTSEPGTTHSVFVRFLALHCIWFWQGLTYNSSLFPILLIVLTSLGGVSAGCFTQNLLSTPQGNTITRYYRPHIVIILAVSIFFIFWFSLLGWLTGLNYLGISCLLFFIFALALFSTITLPLLICFLSVCVSFVIYGNDFIFRTMDFITFPQYPAMLITGSAILYLWVYCLRKFCKSEGSFFLKPRFTFQVGPKSRRQEVACKSQFGINQRFKNLAKHTSELSYRQIFLYRTGNSPVSPPIAALLVLVIGFVAAILTATFSRASIQNNIVALLNSLYVVFIISNPMVWFLFAYHRKRDIAYESLRPAGRLRFFTKMSYAIITDTIQTWLVITSAWLVLVNILNPKGMTAGELAAILAASLSSQFFLFSFSNWMNLFRSQTVKTIGSVLVLYAIVACIVFLFIRERPAHVVALTGIGFLLTGCLLYHRASRRWVNTELGQLGRITEPQYPNPLRTSLTTIAFLAILPTLALIFFSGPSSPIPNEDPLVTLNRSHRNTPNNAASLYSMAFSLLHGNSSSTWYNDSVWNSDPSVRAEAASWIKRNQEALEISNYAAKLENLWFELIRDKYGIPSSKSSSDLGKLCRLYYWKARIAATENNLAELTDCIKTLNAIGRQIQQTPLLTAQFSAQGFIQSTQQYILLPFSWENTTERDLTVYITTARKCCNELPTLTSALEWEPQHMVWKYSRLSDYYIVQFQATLPPARLAKILSQRNKLYCTLTDLPLSQQSDPQNPIRRQVQILESEGFSLRHPIRSFPSILSANLLSSINIRIELAARQRGNRTALEVFSYRNANGHFPDSLKFIKDESKIDPYSGKPFIYRKGKDSFTLYSVGLDRDDDGGRHHRRLGKRKDARADGDYVFWPIPGYTVKTNSKPNKQQLGTTDNEITKDKSSV